MMQRYIPREHAPALVVIPTPRIKTPAVKRKRYESMKTIKTQSRGHDARLREDCTPSTRTRREIRWLTTETPNRWTTALASGVWPGAMVVYLGMGGRVWAEERYPPEESAGRKLIANGCEE